MNNENNNLIKTKINDLLLIPNCCKELKEIAIKYLDSIGTATERENAFSFINELYEDVLSIDDLISFTLSDSAVKLFGKEQAQLMHDSAINAKENGEKYCICEACQAGKQLILLKDEILNN